MAPWPAVHSIIKYIKMKLFTRCFLCFLISHEVYNNGSLICYSQKNNFATDTKEQGIDEYLT